MARQAPRAAHAVPPARIPSQPRPRQRARADVGAGRSLVALSQGAAEDLMTPSALFGWSPQTAIATRFPQIAELRGAIQDEIREIAAKLDREESGGGDMSRSRQILRELRWRLEYTAHTTAAYETLDRLRATAVPPFPDTAYLPDT